MAICPTCQGAIDDSSTACPNDGTPLAADANLGAVLGERYRLMRRIGEGAMGTIYLAEHVVLGKPMAVKLLHQELSRDEELVRRFQQEAIAASRIGQENIVSVHDFGRAPTGALYFVMEYLQGEGLHQLIRAGPIAPARLLRIAAQMCRALAAAHSRGIVHRDLKPDNVIVVRRGDGSDLVKVLDFGISKVLERDPNGPPLTRTGIVMGTPEYMAPEQVEAAVVDARADIYALGAVMYEMLTGTLPFSGKTPAAILAKHQAEPLQSIRERRPELDLPGSLDRLIAKMMAKQPDDRPPSMEAVLAELSAIAESSGVPAVVPASSARSFSALMAGVGAAPAAADPTRETLRVPAEELGLGPEPRTLISSQPLAAQEAPTPLVDPTRISEVSQLAIPARVTDPTG